MIAVGEHLWGTVDEQTIRISTAFRGGLGSSYQELCGALSGGAILIGVQHGRTCPDDKAEECKDKVASYRERFLQEFGSTICCQIRDSGYGTPELPCARLVEEAVPLLLGVLEINTAD